MQELSQETFQNIRNYIEEVKELLSSDFWENIFLDCTKNEVLIFWLLYQKEEANMSEIADYIHVPLNTATGIVGRMEKRGLILRKRSEEDKRVVLIAFDEKGRRQFQQLFEEISYYGMKVMSSLTVEEMALFRKMTGKVIEVLKERNKDEEVTAEKKVRRIAIE